MGREPRGGSRVWRGGIPGRPRAREIWNDLRREDGVGLHGNPSLVLWRLPRMMMVWEPPSEGD